MKKVICLSIVLMVLLTAVLACSQPTPTAAPTAAPPKTTAPTTAAPTTAAPTASPKPTTAAPTTAGDTYTFRYDGYFAQTSANAKRGEIFLMDRITALSKGRVKWQYFPSQQLGTDLFTIVGKGTADFGHQVGSMATSMMPVLSAMDLPFLYKNTDIAGHIRVSTLIYHRQEIADAFATYNLRVAGSSGAGTLGLWLKKPVKVMADFKGLKIRSASASQSATFNALGASAQSLLSSEVYMALSTGVVDGSVFGPASAWDNKLYEVVKYGLIPRGSLGANAGTEVMSLSLYNKLPQDMKDVVDQAAKDLEDSNTAQSIADYNKAVADLTAKGIDIYTPPLDEVNKWRTAVQGVYDQYLKDNGAQGKALLDYALKELGETK